MLDTIFLAIPAFMFFLAVEWLVGRFRGIQIFDAKDTATSISMGVGRLLLGLVADGGVLLSLVLARELGERFLGLPTFAMNQWWHWVLAYLVFDFAFYWMHRGHHVIRIGWAGHVTHHSSQKYNLATALRQSWTEHLTAIPFWIPVALIGFPAEAVLLVYAINLLHQFWIHTELIDRLGPLESFLNTPSHHRVHHGSDIKYLDKNFGGTFIVWDRLFGTFQKEEEPVNYGLIENLETHNPIMVAFHEWIDMIKDARKAPGLVNKVRTLFKAPGWMPGDDSQTVRVQQRALRERETEPPLAATGAESTGS